MRANWTTDGWRACRTGLPGEALIERTDWIGFTDESSDEAGR